MFVLNETLNSYLNFFATEQEGGKIPSLQCLVCMKV